MQNPVDRFCEMLSRLDREDAEHLTDVACLGLGCQPPSSIDRIRKQLARLIDEIEIHPEVAIAGTLQFMTSIYDTMADPEETSRRIDNFLDRIRALEAELEKPLTQRQKKATDEQIRQDIERGKGLMSLIPGTKADGERLGNMLSPNGTKRSRRLIGEPGISTHLN